MTSNKTKLGIVGGTFDPVHNGHVNTVVHAAEKLAIDNVIWIPCKIPPHKPAPASSEKQRLTMLNYALASLSNHSVSTWELEQPQTSYSYHTINYLRAENPDSELYFFMGDDSLLNFTQWYRWQEIIAQCHLVVSHRPGVNLTAPPAELLSIIQKDRQNPRGNTGHIYSFNAVSHDISSTRIREEIHENIKLQDNLQQTVYNYIVEQQLYLNVNE